MAFEYLDTLNPEQRSAVVHTGNPLLILAGAGSGKTRVITTKIAYLIQHENIRSWQILAVTFTKKAADEMRERAVALEPAACESQIKTFHSFGAWFLRKYGIIADLDRNFTVYDDTDSTTLLQKALPHLTKKKAHQLAKKIALCKDYCLTPDDDISNFDEDGDLEEAYRAYQKRLRETGNVDFGDLIMLPVLMLEQNPELRVEMRHHFKVIMVDEYQDSNVAQFRLLQALSGIQDEGDGYEAYNESEIAPDGVSTQDTDGTAPQSALRKSNRTYVCVVGDDDQSIYRFRGAEIQNILQFPNLFPNTELIRLERNYRSTASILAAADAVVRNNKGRIGKTLIAEGEKGEKPTALILPNQDAEAHLCSKLIKQAVTSKKCPAKYSDFAILYRTNAQSLEFEHEFLHEEIPYKVVGSLKFYEREEIKDALSYLSLLANPRDEIAFRRIANKPVRGLGEKSLEKLIEGAKQSFYDAKDTEDGETLSGIEITEQSEKRTGLSLIKAAVLASGGSFGLTKKAQEGAKNFSSMMNSLLEELEENSRKAEEQEADDENYVPSPLSYFIEKIIKDSGLEEYHKAQDDIDGTSRVENMQELSNYAASYPCTRLGLLDFLDSINLDRTLSENAENEENTDAVTLITLHNTKGLEFNRVIITGLENGIFPREDETGKDLEEERRLFYVGITRARKELTLTSCRSRKLYGHFQIMSPSIFLKEAEEALDVQTLLPSGSVYGGSGYGSGSYGEGSYGGYGSRGGPGYSTGDGYYDDGSKKDDASAFESNPLKAKYKKGTKIFNDDWGYGVVINQTGSGEDFVITVQFENGGTKKFIPKFQQKSLQVIKD